MAKEPDLLTFTGHITPMILKRMEEDLKESLIRGIAEDDPTYALHVEIGRFRDNPLTKNIYVALAGGNTIDPDHIDGRIDNDQLDDIKVRNLPVGEIGGGTYWWRRGVADYACYFVKTTMTYDLSMMYAYQFQARLLGILDRIDISGLVDDAGEMTSSCPYIETTSIYESGGAKKHIWRGKIFWRVLTWRP